MAEDNNEVKPSVSNEDNSISIGGINVGKDLKDSNVVVGAGNTIIQNTYHTVASKEIPTQKFEPKTILIPEGPFWMGRDIGEGVPEYETPKHEVVLSAFKIGARPITNKEFEYFVRKTNKPVPLSMGWNGQSVSVSLASEAALGVSWNDAIEYCDWLSQETARKYSLPNEAQWEKAAGAGNPDVVFPEHLLEWTCSLWGEKRSLPDPDYYYPWKDDERNDPNTNHHLRRVLRRNRTTRLGRSTSDVGIGDGRHGFRVVLVT